MKKIIVTILGIFGLLMMMVSSVMATITTLSEPELTMGYNDTQVVEFCNVGADSTVDVLISPICRDKDGLFGCQPSDEFNPLGFNVESNVTTLLIGECAALTLTTNLAPEEGGVFYYTANSMVGGASIGSETGRVEIPEFGTIAAFGVLAASGLFIFFKRK